MQRATRQVSLGLVFLCLAGTLVVGYAIKAPCARRDWTDGRQYRRLCYSDIVPLYGSEHLGGTRLPYLDRCSTPEGQCDEYPVLTMYAMRLAAWLVPASQGPAPTDRGYTGFFAANATLLVIAAFATATCLYLLAGARALYFALAPTLAIYGFMNWDLLAVALATGATLAYLRRRDVWSGVLLGLGAATKLYPGLLVVPFALDRIRHKEPDRAVYLGWAAAGTWVAVNIPFALLSFGSWQRFFSFNSTRPADFDSLWFLGCRVATGHLYCTHTAVINVLSAVAFAGLSILLWRLKRRREPDFAAWTFALPLLIAFLLTNKVYSPQYGLWLLPWFAIALPSLPLFVAFEAADVAVFVTRFAWFGRLDPSIGGWVEHVHFWMFAVALLVRAAILVCCLIAWIRRPSEPASIPLPASPATTEAAA